MHFTCKNLAIRSKNVDWNWPFWSIFIIEGIHPILSYPIRSDWISYIFSWNVFEWGGSHLICLYICEQYSFTFGKGPIMSMCRFMNLSSGLAKLLGDDLVWLFRFSDIVDTSDSCSSSWLIANNLSGVREIVENFLPQGVWNIHVWMTSAYIKLDCSCFRRTGCSLSCRQHKTMWYLFPVILQGARR